ncbi:potassium-transporting P-type ATPase B chain KdpB [Mycobacterium tuberculosis variant bovis Bz 31150]|nr:potassium-transporting P-type ATPase B chain KdpB [Mycobacterium tuberculosis variant bovis Bz 31150]
MIARMETSATAAAATSAPRLRLAKRSLFDPMIVRSALPQSLRKLAPRVQARNPVMLVVLVGAVITTLAFLRDLASSTAQENVFNGLVAAFLWFTVLFANFAEAMAEGRGKAQAAALRKVRSETMANRRTAAGNIESVPSSRLDLDDVVEVSAGETIPSDGEIIEGIASVDESAITGESAPVIRESGGDRSAVTGGTVVLSDRIVVRITAKQGQTFIDRMIALVEGAARQQTPNEIALNILLAGLTIIFLLAVVTLQPFAIYSGGGQRVVVLVALLVCLIPTTIGALLSAIGIAGMDRLVQHNVLATSGRAVEAAGDVNTLLLDKTGTITLGNRQATEFVPINGVSAEAVADAAQLSSLADETPEGRSIVVLAKDEFGLRARDEGVMSHARFVPFTAETRMSGVDLAEVSGIRRIRKGAAAAVMKWVRDHGGHPTEEVGAIVDGISSGGGTPLVVAEWTDNSSARAIGVVHLKDIVKVGIRERFDEMRRSDHGGHPTEEVGAIVDGISSGGGTPLVVAEWTDNSSARAIGVVHLKDIVKVGIRERFDEMRRMSIRTVMITGDNPATAKAIAQEAGVDDFLAEATPEDKLALIKREQQGGRLVAMTGDGTNDAPALAQADVGVAMNTGTQAAREAGNMVDLDSDPTKLIEVVEIGKQLLITRGALTTFSIANDVAKYFAIIPAMFVGLYPVLDKLNVMALHSPRSAILSAVIFNALVIVALIPLALRGVRFRAESASAMLRRNLLIYGLGGLVVPFIGIKLVDLVIVALGVS